MQQIICDTNIWYEIGNGVIVENKIPDDELHAHYLTIGELLLSENLLHTPDRVRNAAKAILHKGNRIRKYQYTPFDYIYFLMDPNYRHPEVYVDTMNTLFLSLAGSEDLYKGFLERRIGYTPTSIELQKSETLKINNSALDKKGRIGNKAKFKQEDFTRVNRDAIIKNISGTRRCSYDKISSFDWKNIELYTEVMNYTSLQLMFGAIKFTPHDWNDFLQLIYVQPGNLYWTKEKKWKKIIKDAGMGRYLYEQ